MMKADINILHQPLCTTKFFFISIIFFCCFIYVSCAQDGGGIAKDSQQLISFKNSLLNPNELLSWKPTISPCNFHGVSCQNSRVSSIDLSNCNLNADFSKVAAFLLSLPYLESLVLKNTNISGSVSSVSRDTCGGSLNSLDLADNFISGPVSDVKALAVCSNLSFLNLSKNSMDYSVRKDVGGGLGLDVLQVLDLSYNNISGENVATWLLSSAFPGLEYLSLKGNKVGGRLSQFNFKNLVYLDVSMNNVSSNFPHFSDCSSLQHLDLSSNKLDGDVGNSLSSCKKLSFLNLTNNNLTGTFPNLPSGSIQYLYLQGNDFQGTLPPDVADLCSTLVELDLSFNNLTGSLPQGLGSCSNMEILRVSGSGFSGEFPADIFLNLSSLKVLDMSFNDFYGELPKSLSKMTNLETLDLSSNNISGSIPSELCLDPRNSFKVLYLQNNMFGGPIPENFSNCSNLESLDLSFNYLTGTIPPSLGSLTKLKDLIMWLNQFHGEIPQEFAHLQSLENLILDFNYLSGSIPSGLSNCSNLNWISLSDNELTGEIPGSLGGLASLAILKLGNNSLSGNIPAQLGDCLSLIWLDLNTNYLNGTIPPSLFRQSGFIAAALLTGNSYAYIRNDGSKECHGAGNLLEFGGIRREQLDRVSTRHPCNFTRVYRGITQPTFNHNGSMIFLDLSYNELGGPIPKELGSMYYLQILNLKHNDLSGPIPEELGGLKNVAILDLSYNRLNGTIPQSLTGLALLGDCDLSNNNLSGTIPESAPFDTFPDYKFANNSGLCGYPLGTCGSGSPAGQQASRRTHRRQASLIGSVAIGLLLALFLISGFVVFVVEAKRQKRRKEKKEAALAAAYMENHSSSAKLVSIHDALSINLSTFDKPLRKLTFADLLEATNGFHSDCLVGSGGFGDVYRARLRDGSVVAIKKLIHVSGQGDREFKAEMETIGRVKHRNLVPLLGYCRVGEERLLVYEYMKHGSLEDVLHDRKKTGLRLGWPARRRIAVGAARGLAFLHHNCVPRIIHRDMKSSNVLIDEDLEARVSDFGMARLASAVDTHLSVSTLAGTPGYVPPEYYQSFQCSTRGDIYSYGVFLLELLTGKKPTDSVEFGDNNIVGWVKEQAKVRIVDVFDPVLLREDRGLEIELLQHLKVACACLDDRPSRRPSMIQVMAMFKEIQAGPGLDSTVVVDECGLLVDEGIEMSSGVKA